MIHSQEFVGSHGSSHEIPPKTTIMYSTKTLHRTAGNDSTATGRAGDFLMVSRSCNLTVLLRCYTPAKVSRSYYVFTLPLRCHASATLLRACYLVSVVPCTWLRRCYFRELGHGVRSCYVGSRERRETPKLTPKAQQGDSMSLYNLTVLACVVGSNAHLNSSSLASAQ